MGHTVQLQDKNLNATNKAVMQKKTVAGDNEKMTLVLIKIFFQKEF